MAGSRNPSKSRSRHSSRHSASYFPQAPGSLIFPDGAVDRDAAEFGHPHRHSEDTLFESQEERDNENVVSEEELEHRRRLSWFKRPSALWFLIMIPFIIGASTATIAPRIEIITDLVCRTLRPEYTALSDFSAQESPHTNLCNSDPVVQAAAAKFLIVMNTTNGILSCLTTAWWGSRSDRKGRISTMRICILGLLMTDAAFICVFKFFGGLRRSYWLLLLGPCIEGLLGGLSAASANIHAYIADCTEPAKRSRIFSLYLGLLFSGVAIGPALGSLFIRLTQEVISVFYFAAVMHLCYALVVWFVVPESLFPSQLARAHRAHSNSKAKAATSGRFSIKRLFSFLAPLGLFLPTQVAENNILKRRKDWNLTLLAGAYGFNVMMMGSYPYKFQYASLKFGWSSEILGYWMSVVGLTRALFLTLVLPTVISLFKPKVAVQLPTESLESLSLDAPPSSPDLEPSETEPLQPSTGSGHGYRHNAPIFDLNIARASLVIEITGYIIMSLATTGSIYTVCTAMGSFGAGFSPAVQSLSLAIYSSKGGKESGSLFGALSVVNALGAQMISPSLFGFTYAVTVGTFPQAIFLACAAAMSCSLVLISFVRLPKVGFPVQNDEEETGAAERLSAETSVIPVDHTLPRIIVVDATPAD